MARRLSLSGDFWGQGEALPSYDTAFTPQEFEAKAEAVAEQTRPQVSEGKSALFQDSGPSLGSNPKSAYHNEFEDWDDAKFEAAAAAYQQRRMQQQGAGSSTQPTASSSHNRAQSPRHDAGTPVANRSRSRPASPPTSHSSPPLQNYSYNQGRSSIPAQSSYNVQRGNPSRPTTTAQSTFSNLPPPPPPPDLSGSMPWMSGASSDGHGRNSMDVPPPFAPMDPSTEFATSPISEGVNSSAARSRAASPPRVAAHSSPPPRNSTRSPGQLPAAQTDYSMQRNLPHQPSGPRSRPSNAYSQQRVVSSQQTTRSPPPASPTDTRSSQPWMSGASSDGHGRGSMDVPPPFAAMDPSLEFSNSPPSESPLSGPTSPPQAPSNISEARYLVPPPPPLNIPQAPESVPSRPTSSPSPQPAAIPSFRHSDIPSPSVHTPNASAAVRQRLSDVPSAIGRPAPIAVARAPPPPPPPGFPGAKQAALAYQFDKKMALNSRPEAMSKAAALYASAMGKTSAPSVRVDLNTMAYQGHGQNQASPGVKEVYQPGSFYSSSVSSVMSKKQTPTAKRATMAPQPPPRRMTNESEYSPYTSPQSDHYGSAYGAQSPPTAYGAQPMQNYGSQGFYTTQATVQNSAMLPQTQGFNPYSAPLQQQQIPQQQQQIQQQHQHHPHHYQTLPAGYQQAPFENHRTTETHFSLTVDLGLGNQQPEPDMASVVSSLVNQQYQGDVGYNEPASGYSDWSYTDTGYTDTGVAP